MDSFLLHEKMVLDLHCSIKIQNKTGKQNGILLFSCMLDSQHQSQQELITVSLVSQLLSFLYILFHFCLLNLEHAKEKVLFI